MRRLELLDAYHEVGHAIMTIEIFPEAFEEVVLHPQDYRTGNTIGYSRRRLSEDNWTEILIGMAGAGAEYLAWYGVTGQLTTWTAMLRSAARVDWRRLRDMYLPTDSVERRAAVKRSKTEVLTILQNNWNWVIRTVDALIRNRRLSHADLMMLREEA